MCFSLSFFLGGEKNKSNKKLKEKASTYNPSLMIPRMFKLTHPFLLIIITSKTSFSPDKVVVLRSRVSPPSHLWLIFRCGLRSCDEQFGFICFALFFCFFFTQVQVSSHSLFLLLSLTFTSHMCCTSTLLRWRRGSVLTWQRCCCNACRQPPPRRFCLGCPEKTWNRARVNHRLYLPGHDGVSRAIQNIGSFFLTRLLRWAWNQRISTIKWLNQCYRSLNLDTSVTAAQRKK